MPTTDTDITLETDADDGLGSLRDAAPSPPSSSSARAQPDSANRVFVVYRGKCGAEHEFDHQGPRVMLVGSDAFMLYPGLNILDGMWAKAKAHPGVAKLIEDRMVTETDENLRGFDGAADLRDLASTSEQPEALEFLLEREKAKKVTAGRGARRDQKIIETLTRRLAHAARVHRPDLSQLVSAAADKTAAINAKAAAG